VCADPGTLWIVATPIGTLGDLSTRAREVLASVDLILSEDTRRARRLLSHLDLPSHGRLQSFHEHNEEKKLPALLRTLREGVSIALISDAGTPVLSDPGFLLVRAARREDLPICSVPGASAFVAALAAAGQPPLPATLCGFLPARRGARRRRIAELAEVPWTTVILLSPHRLALELGDLADILGGERPATLLAELSKVHERAVSSTLAELEECDEAKEPRGEYIVVVGPHGEGKPPAEVDPERVRSEYRRALDDGMDRREALRATAVRFRIHRRQVFDLVAADQEGADEIDL
jgi:16S rRNA (cytidine1402-2'-O)-methyltransferase